MHSDPATACLDEEAIAKLVSGAGSATLLTEAEAHLTTCQRCQRVLADAAHAVRTTNHPVSRDSGAPPAFPSTWQGALAWLAPAGGPAASFGEASAALQEPSPAPPGSTGSSSLSPWARTPLPVGTVLAGRFRIVRFIARGGMGQVFEAEDRILGGRVALKTLRFASHAEPESIARFRREVALARSITHRNVCRVFDVGLHVDADSGNQTLFMTMELLTGETLSARVARVGRLSAEEALPIVLDMCAGLSAAHAGGVIHRDFKSGNVILHDGGDGSTRAVVTDFGLARLREAEGSLTEEGQLLGTPATMAPEQVLGERVSAATDIYALGCVLFEMMTGKLPFVGGNQFATANLRLTRPAPLLRTGAPRAPRSWESVVARCLERQPDKRFQTSAEVAVALQLAPPRARRWAGRGLLAGGVALGVCWMVWSNPVRSVATRVVQSLRSEESTAGFSVSSRPDEPSVRLSAEPVIAVLPLDNLSRRGDSDWLSMALREMLSTELASNEHLRVVPGDRVGRAVRDLGSAEAAALSEAGLGIVRASTAAEWVIHGGYTVV
ncbi:MAG TPA: serine/threonine-protein kinase, partial [Polyangiaceae bacterium]|nr:serine/threonine-protein kinase [Polyangiaceae bacterium]